MKKLFYLLFIFSLLSGATQAQLGGLVNKLKNKIADRALGNDSQQSNNAASQNDPPCACQDAKLIYKFTDNLKIDYKEAVFSVLDDGTILLFNKIESKYYTIKDGSLSGPFDQNNSIVKQFDPPADDSGKELKIEDLIARYKGMIVPSGEKYSIVFGGKTYGPFAIIQSFVLNNSKTQFAAIAIKDVVMTEEQGKKMEKAMNNAKTTEEKMALSLQIGQQMQERMAAGGTMDFSPKLVSNVPGAVFDMMKTGGARLSSKVKFDEIVYLGYDKIMDLTGKVIATIDPQKSNSGGNYWLSSDNSRFASFNYGTITFSDGKQLSELFCPVLKKQDNRVYITYMYFSPKNGAIMQCGLPF